MPSTEDKLKEHAGRISALETDVGNLRVDVGKLGVVVEHESKQQTERYQTISTQQLELKELMQLRAKRDEERAKEAAAYREKREEDERQAALNKQKWIQSLFTPQTIIIILVIILGIFGIEVAPALLGDTVVTTTGEETP